MSNDIKEHLILDGDESMMETADVILIVEDKKVYAHSQILSMFSPVFRGMFDATGTGSKADKKVISLDPHERAEHVVKLLTALYNPSVEPKQKMDIHHILLLADKYNIPFLIHKCKDQLDDNRWFLHCGGIQVGRQLTSMEMGSIEPADENDAILWLATADRLGFRFLVKKCLTVLLKCLSSAFDRDRETFMSKKLEEHGVQMHLMMLLVRMAVEITGNPRRCGCGITLANNERVCFPCAARIVEKYVD